MKSHDVLTYNGACCGLSFMTQDTATEKGELNEDESKVTGKNIKTT